MKKNVLIISASLRKGGNSDILASEFEKVHLNLDMK